MVYLPIIHVFDFYGKCRYIYQSHGSVMGSYLILQRHVIPGIPPWWVGKLKFFSDLVGREQILGRN